MKTLESKPFALIGVNVNGYNPKKLKEVMDQEKLNWRSFADTGEGYAGPIATEWDLWGTPTLYLIDHKGVIRHKWIGGPGGKKMDEAIEKLIKVAEGGN